MTTPAAIAGVGAVGLGMSLFGQHKEAKAANQSNKYNAQVLRNNAQLVEQSAVIEEQKAGQAREAGRVAEEKFRQRGEQLKGSQRAGFAGSGVVVDSGSAMDVLEDTTELVELDALNIRHNAELEAFDFEMSAFNKRVGGSDLNRQADLLEGRKRSALLPMTSTLLSGGSQIAGRYFG